MSIFIPTTVGGTISASDSDAISTELSSEGLPPGTRVWNVDVAKFFTLTVSTEALDPDVVLAVKDITGARWIVDDTAFSGVTTDATLDGDGTGGDPLTVLSAPVAVAPSNATAFTATLDVATASLKGLESAADKIIVDGVSLGAWGGARRNEMLAVVPQLTEFRAFGFDAFPASATAPTFDAGMEGGGVQAGASASPIFITRSLFQTAKTGKGAIVWHGVYGTPTGTDVCDLGLINLGGTHHIAIRRKAIATNTHWFLNTFGGATTTEVAGTIVADTNPHNFMLAWNGTNIRFYVDNAISATLTDLTQVSDEALCCYLFNDAASTIKCSKIAIGYIPA